MFFLTWLSEVMVIFFFVISSFSLSLTYSSFFFFFYCINIRERSSWVFVVEEEGRVVVCEKERERWHITWEISHHSSLCDSCRREYMIFDNSTMSLQEPKRWSYSNFYRMPFWLTSTATLYLSIKTVSNKSCCRIIFRIPIKVFCF